MPRYILSILTMLLLTLQGIAGSQQELPYDPREILFICSYTQTPYVYGQISEFQKSYKEQGGRFRIAVEDMECCGMSHQEEWINKLDTILSRHRSTKALVLVGPEANIAFASSQKESYKTLPVYTIMTPLYAPTLPESGMRAVAQPSVGFKDLTSMKDIMKGYNQRYASYYKYDVEGEIQMLRRIYPTRSTFAILSDNSVSGIALARLYEHYFDKHPEYTIRHIDGQRMNMEEAIETYRKLDPYSTIGLLGLWRVTRQDERFISNAFYVFSEINPQLPVFSLTGTGIGYWAVGGSIPRYEDSGKAVAQRIYNELEGNRHIRPETHITSSFYQFDQIKLDEFKIPNSVLPSNADILNQPITPQEVIQKYKWRIVMGIIIIILLLIIVVGTFIHAIHARRIGKQLRLSELNLQREKNELERMNQDLTKAVKQAEEANQLKNNFVANISHEIRTPLNAITGFAEILTDKLEDQGSKEYVDIIRHNSDLLLKLINDILNISKIESNTDQKELLPYNIPYYCQSWIQSYKHKKEQVEVLFHCEDEEMQLVTDINYLQQLVTNLVDNAVKFTEKGYVELRLTKEENGVTLSVTDTGPGIPEERSEDIFERFVKLDYYIQGTGLGLSICRLVAERLQGNIRVDNSYKEGARLVVFLPYLKGTNET